MIDTSNDQAVTEVIGTKIPQFSGEIANPFHRDKLLLHQNKVAALAVGKLIAPQTIGVDLTDGACNQGCVYCREFDQAPLDGLAVISSELESILDVSTG